MTAPCPFCGEPYEFSRCWRDPAHGAYYSALKRSRELGTEPPEVLSVVSAEPEVWADGAEQLDLFGDAT